MTQPFPPYDDSMSWEPLSESAVTFLDKKPLNDLPQGNPVLTVFAWLVIIVVSGLLFSLTTYQQFFVPYDVSVASPSELMQINFQSKLQVGMKSLMEQFNNRGHRFDQRGDIDNLNMGPPEQRYCYCILVNELYGADTALSRLEEIKEEMDLEKAFFKATPEQLRLRQLLTALFNSYSLFDLDASHVVTPDDEAFLKEQLGWSGELVLRPADGPHAASRRDVLDRADNTFIYLVIFGSVLILLLIAGFIIAIVLLVMLLSESLTSEFTPARGRGGIYAETFALWLTGFLVGSFAISYLQEAVLMSPAMAMTAVLVFFFGSMIALVYPVFRGIPFETVREDIGWTAKRPFSELFTGTWSYLAAMPLIAVGMVATVIVVVITSQLGAPESHSFISSGEGSHPIQGEIASGNPVMIFLVFMTACVAAPVVEETFFRGVLYRHLRESHWMPRFLSVLFSAILSSVIFAIIHPQGVIGVPVLMAIAFGFAIAREWRGSLIAPMVMHASHNGIVTCVMLLML